MSEHQDSDLLRIFFPLARKMEQFFTHFAQCRGVSSGSQAGVFCFLMDEIPHRDVFQKDVEQIFQITPPSATSLLRALEHQGLIIREKSSSDARCKRIILTERSIPVQEQLKDLKEQCCSALLRDIPADKLEVFFEVCRKITENTARKQD